MGWDNRYRQLQEGEIVQQGDEFLADSDKGWLASVHGIGRHAPDPHCPAHTLYRRKHDHTGGANG